MTSTYQQIRINNLAAHAHSIHHVNCDPFLILKGIIFSSSGKSKFELLSDGNIIGTFFGQADTTTQIILNLNPSVTNLSVKLYNRDNQACDHYITLMLENNWAIYSDQFNQELDKTLTT